MQSLKSFFHFCSGIHPSVLKRTPTDSNKYSGIGATIFFTGIFAAIAASFAIYTVFNSYFVAIVFGLVWGLMIFNLDRFIVMSMKKKSSFFKEFLTAAPRLVLAVLIAFVISKPLELKLFHSEIAAELVIMEQQLFKTQEAALKERFDPEIALIKEEVLALESQLQSKKTQRDALNLAAIQEADGTGGSMKRNLGPIYEAKKREADLAQLELDSDEAQILPLMAEKRIVIRELEAKMGSELGGLDKVGLTGFASQIDALGRIARNSSAIWYASLFITLLFIAIETAPIFTKLTSERSPYDYKLDEHEFAFQVRHLMSTSRLKNAIEYDMVFDTEVHKHKNQLAIAAEKEILGELISQEVDRIKKEGLSWRSYIKNRNVFGSL